MYTFIFERRTCRVTLFITFVILKMKNLPTHAQRKAFSFADTSCVCVRSRFPSLSLSLSLSRAREFTLIYEFFVRRFAVRSFSFCHYIIHSEAQYKTQINVSVCWRNSVDFVHNLELTCDECEQHFFVRWLSLFLSLTLISHSPLHSVSQSFRWLSSTPPSDLSVPSVECNGIKRQR